MKSFERTLQDVHWRNKSHQDKLAFKPRTFIFFSPQKLGNTELYKVPIERLHVCLRQKMPIVQKQSWTQTSFVSTRVSETGGGGIHIGDLSAPGKENKVQHQVHL